MLDLPIENVCHRFEAAVRVVGGALGFSGRVVGRTHLVEEKERSDVVESCCGKGSSDQETAALEKDVRALIGDLVEKGLVAEIF